MNQSKDGLTRELGQQEAFAAGTAEAELKGMDDFVVPVLQEELDIRKEVFRTGTVRLRKIVHEVPQSVSEALASENIEVERIPMDMFVDVPPPVRVEGDVTVISVVEEVLVLTKKLRLKEELRIARRRSVSNFYQEVTLRSEELVVERLGGDEVEKVS